MHGMSVERSATKGQSPRLPSNLMLIADFAVVLVFINFLWAVYCHLILWYILYVLYHCHNHCIIWYFIHFFHIRMIWYQEDVKWPQDKKKSMPWYQVPFRIRLVWYDIMFPHSVSTLRDSCVRVYAPITGGELRNGVNGFLTRYATDSVRFSQQILDIWPRNSILACFDTRRSLHM